MKLKIVTTIVLMFSALVFSLMASTVVFAASQPNIIFIIYDDLNTEALHDTKSKVKIPYLRKLASESLVFKNAASNVPVCNPSRASFLSGLLPTSNGAYLNGADIWDKAGSAVYDLASLPEHFRNEGYTVWGAGKVFHSVLPGHKRNKVFSERAKAGQNFGPFGDDRHPYIHKSKSSKFHNIQAWRGPDSDFPDVRNADEAVEFLKRKHDKPFFMIYGLWRPHTPYTSPKRFFDMYKRRDFKIPEAYKADDLEDIPKYGAMHADGIKSLKADKKHWQNKMWGYAAGTTFADWSMGRVIEALDKSSYSDNTIVIVTSDNGYHVGDKDRWGKGTLWENANAIPFLVRGPKVKAGKTAAPVSLVDVYPTLVNYTGVNPPEHRLDGNSLVPIFTGKMPRVSDVNFSAYGKNSATIRSERWRYIRYADGSEELYDHLNDPFEWQNLARGEDYRFLMDAFAERIPKNWAPSAGGRSEVNKEGQPRFLPPEPGALKIGR